MAEPQGAGKGGGLLFLAVLLFVSYLALNAVAGAVRLAVGALLLALLGLLAWRVLQR